MKPDKTEFEWTYQPADFFEAPKHCTYSEYDLLIENGKVLVTLSVPQNPIDPNLENRIRSEVESLFLVRQFIKHEKYELRRTKIFHDIGGKKNQTIIPEPIASDEVVPPIDTIAEDIEGNVVRDTRAERIEEETALLDAIAPKLTVSPELHSLVMSYSNAVNDPDNEFVHLYEIRDGLSNYYGSNAKARAALNIAEAEWEEFDTLTNDASLEQSRHRGKEAHAKRRSATKEELEKVRDMARRWIIAFAETL